MFRLALITAFVAGTVCVPARAATVTLTDGVLRVTAPGEEANVIDVERIGLDWEITDRIALTAGPGCLVFEARRARCSGNVMAVTVSAGGGDDLVKVWDAAVPVTLTGGSGDDLLEGADGRDTIVGGAGLDAVVGGAGADLLQGSSGDDLLQGGSGPDELASGSGADILEGGTAADTLVGGRDRDLLDGGRGFDRVSGGNGRDAIVFGANDKLRDERRDDVYYDFSNDCESSPPGEPMRICKTHPNSACSGGRAARAASCGLEKPPGSWPPRRSTRSSVARAAALRKAIRTFARLRSSGRARATSVKVSSVASFRAKVIFTTYSHSGRRLKEQSAVVNTRFWQTVARPVPPTRAYTVKARCTCQN